MSNLQRNYQHLVSGDERCVVLYIHSGQRRRGMNSHQHNGPTVLLQGQAPTPIGPTYNLVLANYSTSNIPTTYLL